MRGADVRAIADTAEAILLTGELGVMAGSSRLTERMLHSIVANGDVPKDAFVCGPHLRTAGPVSSTVQPRIGWIGQARWTHGTPSARLTAGREREYCIKTSFGSRESKQEREGCPVSQTEAVRIVAIPDC